MKKKMASYTDVKKKAKVSGVKIGDKVLLQQKRQDKLSTRYDCHPYTVTKKRGPSLVLQGGNETPIMRMSLWSIRFPKKEVMKRKALTWRKKVCMEEDNGSDEEEDASEVGDEQNDPEVIGRGLSTKIVSFRCHHRGAKITSRHSIDFNVLSSIFLVPTHVNPQFFRTRLLKLLVLRHFRNGGTFDLTRFNMKYLTRRIASHKQTQFLFLLAHIYNSFKSLIPILLVIYRAGITDKWSK